jgi:Xaa-Pro dipeptidase
MARRRAFAVLADRLGKGVLLGVEGLRMRATEYRSLARHFGHERLVDADPALVDLRLVKDPREIDELRRAVAISEAALGETYDAGIGGQTEKQISARLKAAMLAHGATGFAFEPIVLCGGAAADPHGDASERTVAAGNVLLIDFGASYGDMHADITRTVFCEHASDAHAAIYETVLSANEAGRQAVRAGASVGDVDAAATDRLLESPFADLILHKTGHGLGREVHEAPAVMRSNTDPQRTGMVFTIEPGLYRRNDIGVRIEDNVVVTEKWSRLPYPIQQGDHDPCLTKPQLCSASTPSSAPTNVTSLFPLSTSCARHPSATGCFPARCSR